VDRGGRDPAGRHGSHRQIRSQDCVSTGEDPVQIGGERPFIGGNTPRGHLQPFALGQRALDGLANGRDERGTRDLESGAIHPDRPAPPGFVRLAQRHAPASHLQTVRGLIEAHRRHQEIDVHAFGFGGFHFVHRARHLGPAAAIENANVLRAQAHGGPGAIHRRVAASDHQDCGA
jgi:hypothetical protein